MSLSKDERAFQKLNTELGKLGYNCFAKSLAEFGDYYDEQGFYLRNGKEPEVWWDENPLPGFYTHQATFSCAIPSLGDFTLVKAKDQRAMEILLEIFKLKHARQGFAQAITLSHKTWGPLNKALENVGFTKVASVKSRHGRYQNYVWNWVRAR